MNDFFILKICKLFRHIIKTIRKQSYVECLLYSKIKNAETKF